MSSDLGFVRGQEYTLVIGDNEITTNYLGKVIGHIFTYSPSNNPKELRLISVDSRNFLTDGRKVIVQDPTKVREKVTEITAKVMQTFLKPKLEEAK